jgi:hypothetical protein
MVSATRRVNRRDCHRPDPTGVEAQATSRERAASFGKAPSYFRAVYQECLSQVIFNVVAPGGRHRRAGDADVLAVDQHLPAAWVPRLRALTVTVTERVTGTGYGHTETLIYTTSGPSGTLVKAPSGTECTSAQLFPSPNSTAGEVTQRIVPFSIR